MTGAQLSRPDSSGGQKVSEIAGLYQPFDDFYSLMYGGPLLVDPKGRPLGPLRKGGMLEVAYNEWDLIPGAGAGRGIELPFGMDAQTLEKAKGFFSDNRVPVGVVFGMDMPYQAVWMHRPPDLRSRPRKILDWLELRLWDRPRWALERWYEKHRNADRAFSLGWDLYRHGETWSLDIYAGPLVFEPWGAKAPEGGLFADAPTRQELGIESRPFKPVTYDDPPIAANPRWPWRKFTLGGKP